MGRRGPRTRIASGIYADAAGYAATVRVGRSGREKRFKRTADVDADLRTMQRWQLRTRADLLGDQPARPSRDSLEAAVPIFLATMPTGSSARHDYDKLLIHWIRSPLGPMATGDIRRSHVLIQRSQWEAAGLAASTINHRIRALRTLFDVVNGDDEDAINPCAKIQKLTEPEPEERGAPHDLLEGILACIPDLGFTPERLSKRPTANKSKARLRVMAWTGLPPALLKKVQPAHVDWQRGELLITPRRKGKGVKARRLPLLPEAIEAFRAFDAAGAYGLYSNSGLWNVWQRAKRRYLHQFPDTPPEARDALRRVIMPLRPYDLRHSFAALVYEHSEGNQYAVKDLLMHGSLATSERYIKRAVIAVSRAALDAVTAARSVPTGATRSRPTMAVSGRNRQTMSRTVHDKQPAKPRESSKKQAG